MDDECSCTNLIENEHQKICLDCGKIVEDNCLTFETDFIDFSYYKKKSNNSHYCKIKGDPLTQIINPKTGRWIKFGGVTHMNLEENNLFKKIDLNK